MAKKNEVIGQLGVHPLTLPEPQVGMEDGRSVGSLSNQERAEGRELSSLTWKETEDNKETKVKG